MMGCVVITEFMEEAAVNRLRERHDVLWDDTLVDRRGDLLREIADADAVIVRNRTRVDREFLDASPGLKAVGRLGVGLDNIDLDACRDRGVEVLPATGANAPSVAEYVIASAFVLVRGVFLASATVASGEWPRPSLSAGGELMGRTMGLVGYGGIGREVASRARALGMSVVAHDPAFEETDTSLVPLDELVAEADVISLHVPLVDATRSLFDAPRIGLMKPRAILINTARGGVVDETALADALRGNRIGGAALDVFETEPPGDAAKLFQGLANVILSPHVAGLTAEGNVRVSDVTVDNVMRVLGD